MGKADEQLPDPSQEPPDYAVGSSAAAVCVYNFSRFVQPRCIFAVLLGFAVLISALFWLPPFMRRHGDMDQTDGADIVASFRLQRTVSQLSLNISKLESDIFDEIGFPNSTIEISSLDPIPNTNYTTIIFNIFPYPVNSTISETWLSILRSSFTSLAINEWTLQLDRFLFGNSTYFQILKFPRGITIIPPQNAFLLQNPHAVFNFSLNFPICVVKDRVDDLKNQMRQGLILTSYENLYVKLTNLEGSTIDPPTIVQTSIILSVGTNRPGSDRLKQLAQTIRNSSSGSNLGLNHTVFGRVKQIRLSSFLQHSLNSLSPAPSPNPNPNSRHHHHEHHHHHHHHHHDDDNNHKHVGPGNAPMYNAIPPQNPNPNHRHHHHHHHHHHHDNHHDNNKHAGPVTAPTYREIAPHNRPAGSSPVAPSSPVRGVVLGTAQPPGENNEGSYLTPRGAPVISPAPSPSCAFCENVVSIMWYITLLLHLYTFLL